MYISHCQKCTIQYKLLQTWYLRGVCRPKACFSLVHAWKRTIIFWQSLSKAYIYQYFDRFRQKPCHHLLLSSLPTHQALFSSAKTSATSSLSRSRLFCSNWCLKDEGDVLSRIDSLPQWAAHHQLDLLQLGTLTSKQKIVCGPLSNLWDRSLQ